LEKLVREYAPELVAEIDGDLPSLLEACTLRGTRPENLDEWVSMEIKEKSDLADLFVPNFYFGCEADDNSTASAFAKSNPFGAELKVMIGSDISHFDVPDFTKVLPETYEMLEHGLLTAEQFKKFTFSNAAEMFQRANSSFFEGTEIASKIA
jgi:hypothetical protein